MEAKSTINTLTSTTINGEMDHDNEAALSELLRQKLEIEARVEALRAKIDEQETASITFSTGPDKEHDEDQDDDLSETISQMAIDVMQQSVKRVEESGVSTQQGSSAGWPSEDGSQAASTINLEALQLIREIRDLPPPRLKLTKPPARMTAAEIRAENIRRNRISTKAHPLKMSTSKKGELRTTDDPKAQVAPSVTVKPAPLREMPKFDDVLKELGIPEYAGAAEGKTPLYFADCRILSEAMLKRIIMKRADILVERMQSTKVNKGTQTFVTNVGKQYVVGCVNCRSEEHHFKACQLPYRPGFCRICGADGFDTEDCIYPHGIEHEYALGRCPGCSTDLSLYCPECPDCNVRYGDITDWLRLNYATWPTALVPKDHQYLINEGTEVLKRKVKAKFDDPADHPNRVRAFLIRENALSVASSNANPATATAPQLSEEKRLLALQVLSSQPVKKSLDEIMREKPEMQDGEEIRVLVPTKYKK